MQIRALGREDPLEEELKIHSRNLAWKIPRSEEPGGLQSMRSQKSQTLLNKSTITIGLIPISVPLSSLSIFPLDLSFNQDC